MRWTANFGVDRRRRDDRAACDADSGAVGGRGGFELLLAGQDCHAAASGAHTGDIAAEMLKDAGASAVIVGHSERRGGSRRDERGSSGPRRRPRIVRDLSPSSASARRGERRPGITLEWCRRQLKASLPKRRPRPIRSSPMSRFGPSGPD